MRHWMDHPLVIPNGDGAGVVDRVGPGVEEAWIGQSVWIYNGQRGDRAFRTAAELIGVGRAARRATARVGQLSRGRMSRDPLHGRARYVFMDAPMDGQTVPPIREERLPQKK